MEKNNGYRIAGFVLGLVSVLSGGLILAILGLVFSLKCKKALKENNEKDGLVTAGLTLSIIGIVKTFILTFLVIFGLFLGLFTGNNTMVEKSRKTPHVYTTYYDNKYIDELDEKFDEKIDEIDEKFDKISDDLEEYFDNFFDNF